MLFCFCRSDNEKITAGRLFGASTFKVLLPVFCVHGSMRVLCT